MELNQKEDEFATKTTTQNWGDSIGIRIPQKLVKKYGISNGTEIMVTETDKRLILERVEGKSTLDALLSQVTEENKHEEYFVKAAGRELL